MSASSRSSSSRSRSTKRRSKAAIDEVRQRDGRCVGCGREGALDVHHVDTWGATGVDDPKRMVCLCRLCHSKWHNGDPLLRRVVEEHLERVSRPGWIIEYTPSFLRRK